MEETAAITPDQWAALLSRGTPAGTPLCWSATPQPSGVAPMSRVHFWVMAWGVAVSDWPSETPEQRQARLNSGG